MPHKFKADRRDKIPKQRHRVTNWAEYNEGLRRRGDLTVWISEDALALWPAPRRTTRGGQPHYSDLAIELCLTLGLVFKQPLRQTQGLMRSIARLPGVACDRSAGFFHPVAPWQWADVAPKAEVQVWQTSATGCGQYRSEDLWRR